MCLFFSLFSQLCRVFVRFDAVVCVMACFCAFLCFDAVRFDAFLRVLARLRMFLPICACFARFSASRVCVLADQNGGSLSSQTSAKLPTVQDSSE